MTESGGYGPWAERALTLDDELKVTSGEAWPTTLTKQLTNWCREHPGSLRKGIQAKSAMVFEKYTVEDAVKQVDSFEKAVKKREKVSGVVQEDVEYNGAKNLPRLCLREILRQDYMYDCLKQCQTLAELNPDNYGNEKLAALDSAVSAVVSKAQTKGSSFNMEGTEVFIPCKVGINNYKELLDMEKAKGKASVMLFPGVTKVFKDKAGATDHLNKKLASDAKQLFKVMFKVTVCADLPPCDVKKVLGEDGEMTDATLPDGIF